MTFKNNEMDSPERRDPSTLHANDLGQAGEAIAVGRQSAERGRGASSSLHGYDVGR